MPAAHHPSPWFTMTTAPSRCWNHPLSFTIQQTNCTHISVVLSTTMCRSNKVSKYQLIFLWIKITHHLIERAISTSDAFGLSATLQRARGSTGCSRGNEPMGTRHQHQWCLWALCYIAKSSRHHWLLERERANGNAPSAPVMPLGSQHSNHKQQSATSWIAMVSHINRAAKPHATIILWAIHERINEQKMVSNFFNGKAHPLYCKSLQK